MGQSAKEKFLPFESRPLRFDRRPPAKLLHCVVRSTCLVVVMVMVVVVHCGSGGCRGQMVRGQGGGVNGDSGGCGRRRRRRSLRGRAGVSSATSSRRGRGRSRGGCQAAVVVVPVGRRLRRRAAHRLRVGGEPRRCVTRRRGRVVHVGLELIQKVAKWENKSSAIIILCVSTLFPPSRTSLLRRFSLPT